MSDIDKFLGGSGPSVDDFLGIPPKSSAVRRVVGDAAVSALKGVVGTGEALVGLADIPTGGRAGKFLEQKVGYRPKETQAAIEDFYTPEQKAANAAVRGADGFVDTLAAAAKNPSAIVQSGIESVPLMFGGGAIARGAKVGSAVVRGAAGEGAVGAGSAAEQIRQETETGDLTAKQAALAAASGAGTGIISLGAGKVAQKLGVADIDTLIAGGGGGAKNVGAGAIAKGIGKSAFTEGALEELPQSTQEQMLQNLALDKPIGEGVGNAAATGLLTGGLFGAVGGAASQYGNFVDGKKVEDLKATDPAPSLQPGPEGGVVTPGGQAFPDQNTFQQAWNAASEKEREDFISGSAKAEQSIDAMTQEATANAQQVRDEAYRTKPSPSAVDFAPLSPEAAMERMRVAELSAQEQEKRLFEAEVAAGQKLPDTGAISRAVNAGVDSGAVPVVNGALASPQAQAEAQVPTFDFEKSYPTPQFDELAKAGRPSMFDGLQGKDLESAIKDTHESAASTVMDYMTAATNLKRAIAAGKTVQGKDAKPMDLAKMKQQLKGYEDTIEGTFSEYENEFGQAAGEQFKQYIANQRRGPDNATNSVPDTTSTGGTQTGGVVDAGNNVPAGADVAAASSPAQAPAVEGSALPFTQQTGQTERGQTEGAQTSADGARTLEPAAKKKANKAKLENTIAKRALAKSKETKSSIDGRSQAKMPEKAQSARSLTDFAHRMTPSEFVQAAKERDRRLLPNITDAELNANASEIQLQHLDFIESAIEAKKIVPKKALEGYTVDAKEYPNIARRFPQFVKPNKDDASEAKMPEKAQPERTFKVGDRVSVNGRTIDDAEVVEFKNIPMRGFEDGIDIAVVRLDSGKELDVNESELAKPRVKADDTSPLVKAMNDLADVRARIDAQGQIVDDRLLSRERQLKALVKELEANGQNDKPSVVDVPKSVSEAFSSQMQNQKSRITKWRNEAKKAETLADKQAAQSKVADLELALRKMRTNIFDAEDAAVKAIESGNTEPFAKFAELYPYVAKEITALTGQNDELDAEMRSYEDKAERSQTANKSENTEKTPVESASSQTSNSIQPSANTIFTEDAAEKARAILKKKLYGTLNSGIDPEILQAGLTLAGYHIEKGARTFAAYSKAMIADLGEGVRPYLKSWYMGVKFDPRAAAFDGMDSAADVELLGLESTEKQADTDNSENADDTTQQPRADNGNEESGDAARADSAADSRPLDGGVAKADAGNAEGRKPTERTSRASRARKDSGSGQPELFSFGETREDGGVRDRPTTTGSITPQEFTISDESGIGEGGLKKKYADNIAAIKLVKELDATNMRATPEQQSVIAKYVGWGGIKGVFDPDNKQWGKQYTELKELLTPDEFAAARRSMLDAHYTSIDVIDGMYAGLSHIGFRGGRILEPSMGIGNFIGRMPANIRSESLVVGVELDKLTGQLARHIYPNARIATPKGFEEVRLPSDSFDLAIGNPPFGQQSVFDPEHKDLSKFSVHNFFFAKSIDKLRPGGVLSMVVSRYFMDAEVSEAREWIGQRAKLLGAVRLPKTAFQTNANTEVVTDIIFLQKLNEGEESNADAWMTTKSVTMGADANGNIDKSVNTYYVDNPQNILGTPSLSGSQYSANEYSVDPIDGKLSEQIKDALTRILPSQSYEQGPAIRFDEQSQADVAVPENLKNGSLFEKDGVIYAAVPGIQTEFNGQVVDGLTPLNAGRIRGMIKVRDSLRTLMRAELNDLSDAQLNNLRKKLNQEYDAFKAEHGFINAQANRRAFVDDPDLPLLESLEPDYDPGLKATSKAVRENGEKPRPPKAGKADIFQKRVLAPETHIKNVQSAKDALLASLNVYGKIDTDYMAQIYNKPWDQIAAELSGKVFRDPSAGWVTSEEYLSGNVKSKLAHAETLAKMDPDLKPNVEALKAVQPADLPVTKISVRLGSSWLPNATVKQFIEETIGGKATIHYEKSVARWFVGLEGADRTATNITFGTNRVPAEDILVKVMNSQEILVKDNLGTSKEPNMVVNEVETEAAKAKADDLKNKFKNWIWADADRAETLGRFWNDNYNTNRDRVYDGSHLTLPGSNPAIQLRRHQKDAIWRALSDRVILLDHVVGAGKTFMMTGIAKEMRRLGIAKKPMFAVPNHLVRSWRDEIFRLYPSANVLVATEADFEKTNRRRLFGKIATGDWDAVVIGHSSVKKIGLPVASSMKILKEQLDELSDAIETMKRERGDKSVVKDMERIKVTLETRMAKLQDKAGKKDDVVNFEEMGIDALFVDELHEFKNLFFYTQMSRVSGLGNPAGSGKAFDMFVKFRNLVDRFGERAVRVGATGTPVSNSLVEMYNMQRYMQYDELKRRSMHLLDGWAGNYGDIEQVYEVHPSGNGFRVATRFAKFVNLTSLMQMYRSFADTITMKDLKRQATEAGNTFPVPKVKGGRPQNMVVPRSQQQTEFFGIAEFARNEDGSIKFKADGAPSDYTFSPDEKTGKWSYRKTGSQYGTGSYETETQARQALADNLTTPVTGYNKGSILDQFENLRELTKASKGKINALSITNKARKAGLDFRMVDPSAADDPDSKVNKAVGEIKRIYDAWKKDKGAQLVFCDLSVPASQVTKLALKERDVYVRNGDTLKKFKATSHNIPAVESVFYIGKSKDGYVAYDAMTGNKVNDVQGEKKSDVLDQLKQYAEAGGLQWLQTVQGETETLTDEAVKEWRDENETNDADEEEEDSVSLTDVLAIAGNGAKFSVYDDVKAKLIKMGIPAEEVAFIHDANTSKQKAAIFKKVNAGTIRVLLGSTPKMGAGTNVQERLVALHHLDAPWRPSDLEQREGRIVRQGNSLYARDPEGFEVELLRYATDRTYDTRMWQIIEHKANGIEQLRNAGADVNELEDIGGEAANAADMKAAASGNPLILEEIKLRNEVKSLEAQRNGWLNEKITINRDIREITNWLPDQIEKAKIKAAPLMAVRDKNTTDEFSMKVGNTDYAERKDATKAIADSIKGLVKAVGEVTTIANYRGFKVRAQLDAGRAKTVSLNVWVEYGEFQRVVLFHDLADGDVSASGLVTRVDNAINEIGKDVPMLERQLEATQKRLPELRASLDKPFEKEERLNEARVKHADVLRRLKKSGGAVEMTPAMKREFQAAVSKIEESLKDSGFDLPAMSRLGPAKTQSGLPAFVNETVALAEPRLAGTQPQTGTRYAFDIIDMAAFRAQDKDKSASIRRAIAKVGAILLTFDENGQFKTLNNIQIYSQMRGQKWGEKTVGAIMETLPPGQALTIEDIVPTAVGFWDKMGAKFARSEDYMEAKFTPEQYWSAYEKRIAQSNAKFFDDDGIAGAPSLSRQGNGDATQLRRQAGGFGGPRQRLSVSQVREWIAKSVNRVVAPVQIVQSTEEASALTGFDIPEDAAGVAHKGTAILIADNIHSELDAQKGLFHELFHVGLRTKYAAAAQGYENALRSIAMKNENIAKAAGEWTQSFGKDAINMRIAYGMTETNAKTQVKLLAIEEALADMSGDVADRINGLDTLLAALQKLMRAMGLTELADYFEGLTNAEALAMIADARKSMVALTAPDLQPAMSRNAPIWYSELARQVNANKANAMPAGMWKGFIKNAKGIKADEIEASGINDWLDMQQGKVSKEAVLEYLNANGVQVTETVLGDPASATMAAVSQRDIDTLREAGLSLERNPEDPSTVAFMDAKEGDLLTADQVMIYAEEAGWSPEVVAAARRVEQLEQGNKNGTKFSQYQLPGGENYRELLLTLPRKSGEPIDTMPREELAKWYEKEVGYNPLDDEPTMSTDGLRNMVYGYQAENGIARAESVTNDFKSSHFDQPNILAHIRFNERTDAEGKRVLFIEEIQSDWAQSGKRRGFAQLPKDTEEAARDWHDMSARVWASMSENQRSNFIQEYRDQGIKKKDAGVPSAPFVTKTEAWVSLALKRMIRYVAENGFDRVAFTTGEQQAARYDLSKQVGAVQYSESEGRLQAYDPAIKNMVIDRTGVKPTDIADYVGKEVAERLMGAEQNRKGWRELRGVDLKVGGEGMKAFYDKIVPNVANDVLKKLGGGRLTAVDIDTGLKPGSVAPDGVVIGPYSTGDRISSQRGFDITPELRDKAMEGMPVFSRAGTLKDFIEGGDFKKKTTDAVGALFESQRTFGMWHKTVGTQYHKAQVDADFKPVYEAGQSYLRDMATIANNSADLAPDLLPKLQDSVRAALTKSTVSKADEQATSNAIFRGTLDDTVYTSPKDAGLTPKQFELYQQARKAIDNSLDALVTSEAARLARKERGVFMAASVAKSRNDAMIIADYLNQNAETEADPIAATRMRALAESITAKVQRISELKQKGYAPLTRFGTHTVYVTENGVQRSFTLHESQVEANRTAKAMQELYPQAKVTQGILSKEAAKLFQGISPDTLELFGDVATVGPDGQEVFLGQTQVFQEYLKNAVNNRSALKRLIQRKGIEGYSKDVTRVLATFITSNARAASGNYHFGDMLEAANSIPKEKGDVKDEAVKLLQYVQNPVEEAAGLRSFLFVNYLGGSVASSLVNMTQPLLQTFPYLSQWGAGKSASELTKALTMVGKGAKIADERLAAALARAEKDGVVSPQEIHQLYAESSRTFGNNRALRRALTVWGSLFGLAEQFNRRVTFIAAWNIAKDFTPADFQKAGVRSAFEFAEKAVDETQGVYNRGNRPDWARGALGATLFTFKQFSVSYLEFLKRLPNRERAIALAVLVLAAGMQGLPGADDLDDLIDALMQAMGYSWNSKEQKQRALANFLGRDGANFVMNGFSSLPGVPLDVQGRLGLGNLIPGTAALKKSEVNKGRDVIEILGPAGGLVQDAVQSAGKLVTGDIGGAAKGFVPVAIQNAIKSVDMLQFGMYRDEKGRKVLDTDAYDALIKGIGFQPRNVADASRTTRMVNQDIALVKVTESEIAEKMAQGYFEKDQQKILDARKELQDWNATNPEARIRITPAQVQRRVREMNMTRDQRLVKTAPKEVRAEVKAQLQ